MKYRNFDGVGRFPKPLASSPVKFAALQFCELFNRASRPENDPASLWRATQDRSIFAKAAQGRQIRSPGRPVFALRATPRQNAPAGLSGLKKRANPWTRTRPPFRKDDLDTSFNLHLKAQYQHLFYAITTVSPFRISTRIIHAGRIIRASSKMRIKAITVAVSRTST